MWLWNGLRNMVWDSGENNETQQAEAAAETRQSADEKVSF